MSYLISCNFNGGYPYQEVSRSVVNVMVPEYPVGIYYQACGEYPSRISVSDCMSEVFVDPYPCSFYTQEQNSYPSRRSLNFVNMGVCFGCKSLREVTIPVSVNRIRDYSFWGTALTSVVIPKGCVFYEHSFPALCEIGYYE